MSPRRKRDDALEPRRRIRYTAPSSCSLEGNLVVRKILPRRDYSFKKLVAVNEKNSDLQPARNTHKRSFLIVLNLPLNRNETNTEFVL